MIQYAFRDDTPPIGLKNIKNADPNLIGEALDEIAQANGGEISTSAVTAAARYEDHPLHPFYEWDVEKAAQTHWDETSRRLIRCIHRIDLGHDEGSPPRAFLSIHDEGRTSYRTVEEIIDSGRLQVALMRQAERELQDFMRRYRSLKEVCKIVAEARERLKENLDGSRVGA